MSFTPDQVTALKADLNRGHVAQRTQAGRQLSYIEAWWAIAEANRIFGFDRWHRETMEMRQLGEPREVNGKWRIAYMAKVRVEVFPGDRCIIREGTGYGSGIDNDLGQAHESALKEAESDAMKRALMTFGNPFGLALYDKTQAHVSDGAPPPYNPENPPPGGNAITGRKSAAQSKRDGDDAKIKGDIAKCNAAGLRDWHENFDSYTAHIPVSWLDSIRDMLEVRLEELNGAANIAEGEAELDAGFRGAIGSGRADRVAGNNGAVGA